MNKSSLSRDCVKNQQNLIKEDPFNLQDYFKGCEEIVSNKRKLSDYCENMAVKYTRNENGIYSLSIFYIPRHQRAKLMSLYKDYVNSEDFSLSSRPKKLEDFLHDACNYYVHNVYNYEYQQANLERDMYAY